MKLSEEKIKKVLLDAGLSTRRSERLAKNLASRNLFEDEKKEEEKKKVVSRDLKEVVKEV